MMLALTLTLLLAETVRSLGPASLISENMWPRGCVLDCHRGRHRAVCGSNGRLYRSLCTFQRAQCINTQLRVAAHTHCSDPGRSRCQRARSQALESASLHATGHVGPVAAIFVPECHQDGHFLPVQCHNQTGYCWCSTADGKPISGTSVLHRVPDCRDHVSSIDQTTDTDLVPIKGSPDPDEAGEPGPTPESRRSADLTAPPFWVTILMNSDPKGNRPVRRPTDSPQPCERERSSLLSLRLSSWQEERFLPECTAAGGYRPVQCHVATGYCWCVREDSGRPLPGTSTRNRIPECTGAEETPTHRRFSDKPLPGCPGAQKKKFLQSLVRALQLEAEHAGSLSPPPSSNAPSSSPSSSPPDTVPPAAVEEKVEVSSPEVVSDVDSEVVSEVPGPDRVLQWHFSRLDVDSSGVLSERESRPLRRFLRRRLKPRRCAKKFSQFCDRDGDRGLTLQELRDCLDL